MTRRALVAAAVLLAVTACTRVDRLLERSPSPHPQAGAWAQRRDLWTTKASIYDGLSMRVLATATYQAPELRRERAERTAEWKAMTPAERESLVAAEEAELSSFDDFVVSMTTSDSNDNDLDSPRTDWRVALVPDNGATERLASSISEIRPDALLRTLYPAIGDFDVVYRVRFERPDDEQTWARPFTLRIAGPRGRLDFPFGAAEAGADGAPNAAAPAAE